MRSVGRTSSSFGNDESGELCTLVTSCEANGINPIEYLTDVLNEHPASKLDELLPDK